MNLVAERKWTTLLFNPFAYIAGAKSLAIGVVTLLAAGLLGALSHTHFDGVLDTHTGAPAPLWVFVSEGFIDWLSLAVVLWLMGKLVSRSSFRAVDLFGTQAMARWPTVPTVLLTLLPGYQRFTNRLVNLALKPDANAALAVFSGPDAAVFWIVIAAMLALFVWMVALMWKSYSISCNVKGAKAVASFIIGILLAEALSKAGVIGIFKLM